VQAGQAAKAADSQLGLAIKQKTQLGKSLAGLRRKALAFSSILSVIKRFGLTT